MKSTEERTLDRLRFPLRAIWVLIAGVVLAGSAFSAKTARVFVDSEASEGYHDRKESEEGAKYETYVFIKGNFYGGDFKDKSLRTASFEEIVGTLAENMKQRNYYPAAKPGEGDLLIVVHYGTTSVEQDLQDIFLIDPSDPYAVQEEDGFSEVYSDDLVDLSDLNDLASDNVARHRNSMENNRLGMGRALNRKNITATEEFDLRVEMEDERYFIILMAYDYEKLRTSKERELLWTTRFSVPAIGTNFVDAYPALARAASAYYGTSLEKYAKTSTHFGTGTVEIGTLETVGLEQESETSEASPDRE